MADPLSISVSVLAIVGSGLSVSKTLHSMISEYKNAPAAILALSNELSNLLSIIQEVRDQSLTSATATNLSSILDGADLKLRELDLFVKSVGVLGTTKVGFRRYEKLLWAGKNSKKAAELKQDLYDLKISIILLLNTAAMSQLQLMHKNTSVVQSMSLANSTEMEETSTSPKLPQALIPSPGSKSNGKTIAFQVRPRRKVCSDWCSCICHRRSKLRSPSFLDNFLGTLQLAFVGIPMITPSCNQSSCWQQIDSTTSVMYHFPSWLVNRALRVAFINSVELIASLKIPRIVDPNSEIFNLVIYGDLEGVRKLLEERTASPNDIKGDYTRRSILHDAICYKKIEICKLLIKAGADPYIPNYREETAIENVQLNALTAGHWSENDPGLMNPWRPDQLVELAEILPDTSFIHENGFSRLHKAVIQAQLGKLREELEISTKDIDQTDDHGYTPLNWAVARMDPECLEILLYYGANLEHYPRQSMPNLRKLAAQQFLDDSMVKRRNQCLKIAINYGTAIFGQEYFNQLNHDTDPAFYLALACWCIHPSITTLLLDAGANINLENEQGQTPLSVSIMNSSCEAASLILKSPSLNRNLSRKAMLQVLKSLRWNLNERLLLPLINANLRCRGLVQEDFAFFENSADPNLKFSSRRPSSNYKALWERFISDLKLQSDFTSPSDLSEAFNEGSDFYRSLGFYGGVDFYGGFSESVSEGEDETASIESDDEFEDARSSFDAILSD